MKKKAADKCKIAISSVNRVCRLCLSEGALSKTKDIAQTKIRTMIEFCSSIKICKGDGFPSRICASCLQSTTRFYAFKKKIERTDTLLKKHFKNTSKHDILDIALNEAKIKERFINTDIFSEAHSENLSLEDNLTDELPVGYSVEISEIDSQERFNSNVEAEAIFDYPQNETISNNHFKEIKLIGLESREIGEEVSAAYGKNQENPVQIINEKVNESSTNNHSLCHNIKSLQDSIILHLPPLAPIHSGDGPNDKIVSSTLTQEPPPLIPIKPIVDKVILTSIKSSPNLSSECRYEEVDALNLNETKEESESVPSNCLVCNICKKEFKERKKLIGHLKGHMVSKDYGCKICGKRYPNPSTFQIHMRSHTGERPFKCSVCDKGFTRWAGVVSHMQTHDDHRPFKCETCDKSFKIVSNLERHKVLHSGILPFCCNFCGKTFSQSDNLQLHIRTYHTNERPYLCSQCGKGFVSSTRLKRHMWVHTGYKPFRCNLCPKAYSNSSDLKNHERGAHGSGDNEKPFACNLCNMRFFHPCRLSKHLKTHQRPFACNHCNKTFSLNSLLGKHLQSNHSIKQKLEEMVSF